MACRAPGLGWKAGFPREYETGVTIGAGAFGRVVVARDRRTGARVAVKEVPTWREGRSQEAVTASLQREVEVLRAVQGCPGAVGFLGCYEDAETARIVMEHCGGGDLARHVASRGPLDERALVRVAGVLLGTLRSIHARGIVYADLKPSNVCLVGGAGGRMVGPSPSNTPDTSSSTSGDSSASSDTPSSTSGAQSVSSGAQSASSGVQSASSGAQSASCKDPGIRLVDFGSGSRLDPHTGRATALRGSSLFMAPEVFGRSYGSKADVWSLGITLYWLFSRCYPYWPGNSVMPTAAPPLRTIEGLARGLGSPDGLRFDYGPWRPCCGDGNGCAGCCVGGGVGGVCDVGGCAGMSPEGVDFVRRCLAVEEGARMDAEQASGHPWLASVAGSRIL